MRRQIMVIPQLFAIRRRSSPMLHRDKLWSFCTFCHPDAVSPMTCRDKLWSFRKPFAIHIRSCPMARKDKLWSFCAFSHPEAVSPMTCREKLWSFRTPFHIRRKSCPIPRRDKLWSFCAFCHPEAVSPIICRDKLWSFRTSFRQSETIVTDATQRQFMVILRLLSSRAGEPNDMRRQIMIIPLIFTIRRRSSPMARRDKLWSFCAYCDREAASQMICRDKL